MGGKSATLAWQRYCATVGNALWWASCALPCCTTRHSAHAAGRAACCTSYSCAMRRCVRAAGGVACCAAYSCAMRRCVRGQRLACSARIAAELARRAATRAPGRPQSCRNWDSQRLYDATIVPRARWSPRRQEARSPLLVDAGRERVQHRGATSIAYGNPSSTSRTTGGGTGVGADAPSAGPARALPPGGGGRRAGCAGRRHRSAAPPPSRSAVASGIGSAIRGSLLTAPTWTPRRTRSDWMGEGSPGRRRGTCGELWPPHLNTG
jgi:hypothetical protein